MNSNSQERESQGSQTQAREPQDLSTTLITSGRSASGSALAPTLIPTTSWNSESFAAARRDAHSVRPREFYARYSNPTVRAFEESIAELEHAEDALAFGSGMGAVASVILALCSAGSHVVASQQLYSGTLAFLHGPGARLGIETTVVDSTQTGALAAAVQPGRTMLVIGESPSNPLLQLVDLDELGSIMGPFTMIDSTFATPLAQRPLDHGIDIVMHSATKGIAGHNDATLGVIAGEAELIDSIWSYSVMHGAVASPADAFNAQRGIRTMHVRLERQAASAQRIAEWLQVHDAVSAVHYPGLASHPQHGLAQRQMDSFGTVLSFELAGGVEAVERLLDGVGLVRRATSLGGPESLMCHPATTTNAAMPEADRLAMGVTPGLVRLSVGLEHPDDLIRDLEPHLSPR